MKVCNLNIESYMAVKYLTYFLTICEMMYGSRNMHKPLTVIKIQSLAEWNCISSLQACLMTVTKKEWQHLTFAITGIPPYQMAYLVPRVISTFVLHYTRLSSTLDFGDLQLRQVFVMSTCWLTLFFIFELLLVLVRLENNDDRSDYSRSYETA